MNKKLIWDRDRHSSVSCGVVLPSTGEWAVMIFWPFFPCISCFFFFDKIIIIIINYKSPGQHTEFLQELHQRILSCHKDGMNEQHLMFPFIHTFPVGVVSILYTQNMWSKMSWIVLSALGGTQISLKYQQQSRFGWILLLQIFMNSKQLERIPIGGMTFRNNLIGSYHYVIMYCSPRDTPNHHLRKPYE